MSGKNVLFFQILFPRKGRKGSKDFFRNFFQIKEIKRKYFKSFFRQTLLIIMNELK